MSVSHQGSREASGEPEASTEDVASAAPPGSTHSDAQLTGRSVGPGPSRQTIFLRRLGALVGRNALIVVWAMMCVVYAVLMPGRFFEVSTLQAILGSQAPLVFISVSALCTFVVDEFDLSFASVMGLAATILPVLAGLHHVNILLACVIAVAASVGAGIVNAFFIVKLNVSSLIVTLGSASLYLGIAELISSSNTVSVTNQALSDFALHNVYGLPLAFYYGVALCAVLGYVLAWTPLGRHIVFVGSNREVARLAGINVQRIRAMSYITASFVAGLAGVLLVATVGGFDSTASQSYLLPALAGVFLGTTLVVPGHFNPLGTLLGLYFLETGVIGLQLLGYTGWAQDAFYGAGLVLAVTIVTLVRQRSVKT